MWDVPPADPGFEIVVASRGMSKGIAQTDGVQVIPKAFVQFGQVQAGGQWKNVSSTVADSEAAAFVNYAPKLGHNQLTLGAAYKFQTGVKGDTDDRSFEFTTAASRKFGKLSLKLSAIYSFNDLGSARQSLFLEGGASFDIDSSTRLSANLGHRSRVNAIDYTSLNAGISKTFFQRLTVDLRYHDTAQSDRGQAFEGRAVLSSRLTF